MQQLYEANSRLGKYVQATKDQEKVIQRLEAVMGQALQEARKGTDPQGAGVVTLGREGSRG